MEDPPAARMSEDEPNADENNSDPNGSEERWVGPPIPFEQPQPQQQQPQRPLPPFQPPSHAENGVVPQDAYRSLSRSSDPVPIPHRNSVDPNAPSMTRATGPMSSTVNLPKRPKPGRKPLPTEDAVDRRRVQNRIAQRNFRDKRQQKLSETTHELQLRKQQYEEDISDRERRHAAQIRNMQLQLDALKKQNADLLQELQRITGSEGGAPYAPIAASVEAQPSLGRQPRRTGPVAYSSPDDSGTAMETDFTSSFRRQQPNSAAMRPSSSSQSNFSMTTLDGRSDEGHCGFCLDRQNCLCEEERRRNGGEPAFTAGNCKACQQDPERAINCQRLAMQAQERSNEATLAPMVSCATFMDQVENNGGRLESIAKLVSNGQMQVSTSNIAGFEIEEREAAQALQNLSGQ